MEERGGADRERRRGLLQRGHIAAKMNYMKKVPALYVVCLSESL